MKFKSLLFSLFVLHSFKGCLCRSGSDKESIFSANAADENDLFFLAMAPFADPDEDPSWLGGPGLIPAAQLAVDHINNSSDILEDFTLRLLEGNSGCEHVSRTVISFASQSLHGDPLSKKIVGIVGPSCSESAIAIGKLVTHPELSLIQISIASSPAIVNSTLQNSFRAIGSSLNYVDAIIKMASVYEWNKIGAVYDGGRQFHTKTFTTFRNRFYNGENLYSHALNERAQFDQFLNIILENDVRVVFVFARASYARNLLCISYRNNTRYDKVQYLFVERTEEDFTGSDASIKLDNGSNITCSAREMKAALNGTILINNAAHRSDTNFTNTTAGISFQEFQSAYYAYQRRYIKEMNLTVDDNLNATVFRFFSGYYDAVWALALALNQTTGFFNLSEYRFRTAIAKAVTDNMRQYILNKEFMFEGMSGLIKFDPVRRDVPTIGVDFSQCRTNSGCSKVGHFANGVLNFSGKLVGDFQIENGVVPLELGIFLMVLGGVLFALLLLLQVAFCKYSRVKEIKATSPRLNTFIFAGCYLFILVLLSTTCQETFPQWLMNPVAFRIVCSIRYCSLALSFTLIFGTIASKTWRVYRIFGHFQQGPVRYVSDRCLSLFIASMVAIDVALLTAWNIVNPWRRNVQEVKRDGNIIVNRHFCKCDNFIYWVSALFSYKTVIVTLAMILSVLVRRVKKKAFKNTKQVIVLIYSLIFIFFVGLTVYGALISKAPLASFLVFCMMLIASMGVVSFSLFLSTIWPVITKKKENFSNRTLTSRTSRTSIATNQMDNNYFKKELAFARELREKSQINLARKSTKKN